MKLRTKTAALSVLLWLSSAVAAPIPAIDKPVELHAHEHTIGQFLEQLFAHIDVPVQVAADVQGYVNGSFTASVQEICDDIMSSFQLALYYDGAVVHVYRANEVVRSILPVSGRIARHLVADARELGLSDSHNTLTPAPSGGLLVTGARRFVQQIEELAHAVEQLQPGRVEPSATYRVFRLSYAWADDVTLAVGGQNLVIPGVATLLRSLLADGPVQLKGKPDSTVDRTQPGLRGRGLRAQTVRDTETDSDAAAPQALLTPSSSVDVRIVADSRLNAVIIRDTADRMPMYESLIANLDVEPVMLEIEATIIDMDTDRLRELGINWRLQREDDSVLFGNGTASDQLLRPDTEITPQGQGGIVSLVLGDRSRFIARIQALESQGAARIVSKPHVITLSDTEAVLDTTSTFYVRVAGQEEVDLFNVSVGTTMRVTPHVIAEHGSSRIRLLVSIEDGSASDQQVDDIPVIERSTINTQALIGGNESLLVGGLVREFDADSVVKVPLLGDLPLLGAMFRTHARSSSRVERLFLITPRLLRQPGAVRSFNQPVLAGAEAQIVETAPHRLDRTQSALLARSAGADPDWVALPDEFSQSLHAAPALPQPGTAFQPVPDPASQSDQWQEVGG